MRKLRLFLAEDHAVVRDGLRLLLDAQPDMMVVGEAGDGREVVERVQAAQPEIVLMDLSLPGCNGIEATRRLKRALPEIKVLGLTIHEVKDYVRQMMDAGASGYVLKRSAAEALTAAIRCVARGGVHFDPPVPGRAVQDVAPIPSAAPPAAEPLSEREKSVLKLMAWGLSQKEIAAQLGISGKSVETYKFRLMAKLHVGTRTGLVRYAIRQGWLTEL